jgi:putative endonuclease
MTNGPKPAVLYTGITGKFVHRVWQHKHKLIPGFTSRYNLTCLVYYERFFHPAALLIAKRKSKAGGAARR